MRDSGAQVELSVVVPVYQCAECLTALHERLRASLEAITASYEIILVDDRSPDSSWQVMLQLAQADGAIRLIRLSRNFGQHAAITAGLAESRGRWVVVMDCDLQDPPEEIPRLQREAAKGFDIVFARRKSRKHSVVRRLGARAYTGLMNRFIGTRIDGEYGSFSIIGSAVRDAYLAVGDRGRHYLLILHWLGFEHTAIDVEHAPRLAGRSSYGLARLVQHAVDGIFFQTTVLLRWIIYLGFAVASLGVLLAAFFTVIFLVADPYPGWTSLAVLILLVGGFIIMSTGVMGLYVGKIFDQVRDRPLYVVAERVGQSEEQTDDGAGLQAARQTPRQ